MKKKIRLPLLLLAVVIMLSIFYIKEAQNQVDEPVDGSNLEVSTLNPDFTEARLLGIEQTNEMIQELESSIVSGTLTAVEVEAVQAEIEYLKNVKYQEASLEESIIEINNYDDVLVLLGDEYLVIDIYTDEDITTTKFVDLAVMAKSIFGNETNVKVKTTSSIE